MAQRQSFLPALRFDALTRFYDPVVAATTRERSFKRRLVELATLRDGERVIDIGCGTGTLAIDVARRYPGAHVAGVDADDAMLARARAKADQAGVRLDLRSALAQELPFPDSSFDVAVSSLFFHHLRREAKLAAAAEILRVLRPRGRLAIADWGAPSGPVMRVAALSIRLLDGADTTADNLSGLLPELLGRAGFVDVRDCDTLRTPLGTLALTIAQRS